MKRVDGTRIKKADPMYKVAAYIMDKRYDALNYITVDIPLNPIKEYVNEKRKSGQAISNLGLIVAAYVRTLAKYPELNRFVVNSRFYKRNEIAVGMVVLRPGDKGNGIMSKMHFKPEMTVFDVQNEIDSYINDNRSEGFVNSTDKLIAFLSKNSVICRLFIKLYKFMDRHGMLWKGIIDGSPFHASMSISNLASIKTNHIYHHIYDFGTTSVFISLGNPREIPKRKGKEIVFERCLPMGVVMDERVASGSYYAMAFRYMSEILSDPKVLETPPETVVVDEA